MEQENEQKLGGKLRVGISINFEVQHSKTVFISFPRCFFHFYKATLTADLETGAYVIRVRFKYCRHTGVFKQLQRSAIDLNGEMTHDDISKHPGLIWHDHTADCLHVGSFTLFGADSTNSSGFNAKPGGIRYCNGGFYGMGEYAILATTGEVRPGTGRLYLTEYGSLKGGRDAARYERGDDGLSVRCVREKPYDGYEVAPSGIPNPGIMFVNNEATGRSGHLGSTLTVFRQLLHAIKNM